VTSHHYDDRWRHRRRIRNRPGDGSHRTHGSLATVYLARVLFVLSFGYSIDKPSWIMIVASVPGFASTADRRA
jgi:hypothetical protein